MGQIIGPLSIAGMITAIVIFISSRRHRERIELIKRGVNPVRIAPPRTGSKALFLGLACAAIGIAFLISVIVDNLNSGHYDDDTLTLSLVLLFAGISFFVYWKLTADDRERAFKAYEQYLDDEKNKPGRVTTVSGGETENVDTQE